MLNDGTEMAAMFMTVAKGACAGLYRNNLQNVDVLGILPHSMRCVVH